MFITRTLALAVMVSALCSSPTFAEKNTGKFQSTPAANRQLCADLKDMLEVAESEADKRAGTKAAASYAKQADQAWADGIKSNCKWAA